MAGTTIREVLFLAQLPPPIHGASVVSKRAYDVMSARDDLCVTHLWLGGALTNQDVGRKSPAKMLAFATFLAKLAWLFATRKRYAISYLTFAPFSHAALRDGLLIAMSRLIAARTVVHLHAVGLNVVMAGTSLTDRIVRRLVRGAELITITETTAAWVRASNHFKAVHVLANCVADPGAPALVDTPVLRCGYLANLDPRKGVLRFLDCIDEFTRQGLRVTGRIAGPSTASLTIAELTAEIDRRGLGAIVEVAGPLYGEAKTEFFRSIDLFIYLSQHDYFPLVVLEALSFGVVPIVFDIEGQRELVGPTFANNVLAPDLTTRETLATATTIARRYCESRADLNEDKAAARARYLTGYAEENFRKGLETILDRGCVAVSQSK